MYSLQGGEWNKKRTLLYLMQYSFVYAYLVPSNKLGVKIMFLCYKKHI